MSSSCGSPSSPTDPPSAPASASSPAPSSAPVAPSSSYLPTPEPELTVPERASGAVVRVTGTVERAETGEPGGCRMLNLGDGTAYALVTSDARVTDGAKVTVEGRRSPGLATTCQRGVPFVVTEVVSVD